MNGVRRVRGAGFGGCNQEALGDCPSHNARGHTLGFSDAQTAVGDKQIIRMDSSGIHV